MVLKVEANKDQTKPYYTEGFINGNRFKAMIDTGSPLTIFALDEVTRRERLKSAPFLRLKKRKKNFWKKLKILKIFFFQKKSHSVEKCKWGILLDLLPYIPLQRGTLWGQKNFRKKVAQCRKKLKGGTS